MLSTRVQELGLFAMKYEKEIEHIMASMRLLPTDFLSSLHFKIGVEIQERDCWLDKLREEAEAKPPVRLMVVSTDNKEG